MYHQRILITYFSFILAIEKADDSTTSINKSDVTLTNQEAVPDIVASSSLPRIGKDPSPDFVTSTPRKPLDEETYQHQDPETTDSLYTTANSQSGRTHEDEGSLLGMWKDTYFIEIFKYFNSLFHVNET